MARIAGVNIPTSKKVEIGLTYIHGISLAHGPEDRGPAGHRSDPPDQRSDRVRNIQIREIIDRDFLVEGDLRRDVAMNIKRLMDLGCYRGLRHRKSLPVRGQRTHTNARTRKGPAKAIAGKKKVTK